LLFLNSDPAQPLAFLVLGSSPFLLLFSLAILLGSLHLQFFIPHFLGYTGLLFFSLESKLPLDFLYMTLLFLPGFLLFASDASNMLRLFL